MTDKETPSDAQLTDAQRHKIDTLHILDREADRLEDQRTESQPVKDDPAQS